MRGDAAAHDTGADHRDFVDGHRLPSYAPSRMVAMP
jgi:hypothetical protein